MPLPQFKNEKEFREKFIAPFLAKRGLIHVNHTHGSGEQGKDFFFADRDVFENTRFYAVQAKIGNIGSGRRVIDDLINQVRRCFTVRLRFHNKDSHERGCCAVYIMTTGSISPEARKELTDWCRSEHYGDNVHFLDGETLDRLQGVVQRVEDSQAISTFTGICIELIFNLAVCESVRSEHVIKRPPFRTHAMSLFVCHPIVSLPDVTLAVIKALSAADIANAAVEYQTSAANRNERANEMLKCVEECNNESVAALKLIESLITEIQKRRTVTVELRNH